MHKLLCAIDEKGAFKACHMFILLMYHLDCSTFVIEALESGNCSKIKHSIDIWSVRIFKNKASLMKLKYILVKEEI